MRLSIAMEHPGNLFSRLLVMCVVVIGLVTTRPVHAQTAGGSCSTYTGGGSVVISSGSGASTVYTRLICDNSSIWREQESWTIGGRTSLQIRDASAVLNASCTGQTGRLSYNSGTDRWYYCNGTKWLEFAIVPLASNLDCFGSNGEELLGERAPYRFSSIYGGGRNLCGLISGSRPVCLGGNIGIIKTSPGAAKVEPGYDYACLIDSTGAVKCYNSDGDENPARHTGTVPAGTGYTDVDVNNYQYSQSVGNSYLACAISSAGAVSCWGDTVPAGLPASGASQLAVGTQGGLCVVNTSGVIACYGNASTTGIGTNSNFTQIATNGRGAYCARKSTGAVDCWGNNIDDPVGVTTATKVAVGTEVFGSGSKAPACALLSTGAVSCWGDNSASLVTESATVSGATDIAAGYNAICAIIP